MLRRIFMVPLCVLTVALLVLLYRAHPALGVATLGLVLTVGFARWRKGEPVTGRRASGKAGNPNGSGQTLMGEGTVLTGSESLASHSLTLRVKTTR